MGGTRAPFLNPFVAFPCSFKTRRVTGCSKKVSSATATSKRRSAFAPSPTSAPQSLIQAPPVMLCEALRLCMFSLNPKFSSGKFEEGIKVSAVQWLFRLRHGVGWCWCRWVVLSCPGRGAGSIPPNTKTLPFDSKRWHKLSGRLQPFGLNDCGPLLSAKGVLGGVRSGLVNGHLDKYFAYLSIRLQQMHRQVSQALHRRKYCCFVWALN